MDESSTASLALGRFSIYPSDMTIVKRVVRKLVYTIERAAVAAHAIGLSLSNRFSSRPVFGVGGPVVCVTTYGERERDAYLTIESIARGRMRPSRLILWLDERPSRKNYPKALKRLEKRGLEVKFTQDYGPHKKYYPYVKTENIGDSPLVTADDDVLYPPSWLEGLWAAYLKEPSAVHCYRARVITFAADGSLTNYASWELCNSSKASHSHFPTGTSGVLYPPAVLRKLRQAGDLFLKVCPKGDDFWLNLHSLRAGLKVQQVNPSAVHFPTLERTQSSSLQMQNLYGGRNDIYIRDTYNENDLKLIRSDT